MTNLDQKHNKVHIGVHTDNVISAVRVANSNNMQRLTTSTDTDTSINRTYPTYINIDTNDQRSSYNKFENETDTNMTPIDDNSESTVADELYKLTTNGCGLKTTPSKIQFQLYRKPSEYKLYHNKRGVKVRPHHRVFMEKQKSHSSMKTLINENNNTTKDFQEITLLTRLKNAFNKMQQRNIDEECPFEPTSNLKTNNNNNNDDEQTTIPKRRSKNHRIDLYYFDHGSAEYFRTTDYPPNILSEILAQQTTLYATRFWAEVFGSLHIGVTFFVTFFLQTYRFILYSIVKCILVGFLQMTSDYFLKPFITVIFNGFIQPPLVLFYNILSSIRDMLEPVASTIDNFLKPFANVLKSIRLITFTNKNENGKSLPI